jgi:regulator of extracellular matrix RemA (YlzA/DUF370 family)
MTATKTTEKKYNLESNAIRVANGGALVTRSRILGIFSVEIPKVLKIKQRLISTNQLVDVCRKLPGKSLILLDNGFGILSPITVLTLSKQFNIK